MTKTFNKLIFMTKIVFFNFSKILKYFGSKISKKIFWRKHHLALVIPYMGRRGKFWLGHSFFTPSDFAEFLKLIFTASTRHTRKLKTSLKPSKTNLSFWRFLWILETIFLEFFSLPSWDTRGKFSYIGIDGTKGVEFVFTLP